MLNPSNRIGAVGAILDEYQKAIDELKTVISQLENEEIQKIIDHETDDKDCVSIQSILSHVVESGYTYVIEIRKWLGENLEYHDKVYLDSATEYIDALQRMFKYNEQLFNDYPNLQLVEYDRTKTITVRWGQNYDVDQLLEHAIMHILRHRRQIEKFILRLNN